MSADRAVEHRPAPPARRASKRSDAIERAADARADAALSGDTFGASFRTNTAHPPPPPELLPPGGAPLAPTLRRELEAGFGADLSGVRIHHDAAATAMARQFHARAYTVSSAVVIPADITLTTPQGRRLLAHEVAHVLQGPGEPLVRRQEHDDSAAGDRVTPSGADPARIAERVSTSSQTGSVGNIHNTAGEWLRLNATQLMASLHTLLENTPLALPIPELRWRDSQAGFVDALLHTLETPALPIAPTASGGATAPPGRVSSSSDELWAMLDEALRPDSLRDAINIGRDSYPDNFGRLDWAPGVADEIARRLALHVVDSLDRVADRYARMVARGTTPQAYQGVPAPVAPGPLALFAPRYIPSHLLSFSHPLDPIVFAALADHVDVDVRAYRAAHPAELTAEAQAADARPLRHVTFEFLADQGLPNWIRVTSPYDASAEEVAFELYGDASAAYRLIAAPPMWGLPAKDIPGHPEPPQVIYDLQGRAPPREPTAYRPALRFEYQEQLRQQIAAAHLLPSDAANLAPERQLLASPLADEAALRASARILPTPGANATLVIERLRLIIRLLDEMRGPAGELVRPPGVARTMFVFDESRGRWWREPYNPRQTVDVRNRIAAARARVQARLSRLTRNPERATAWDAETAGQLEIVNTAASGLSTAVMLARQYRNWPRIHRLIAGVAEGYVAAVEVSDLYPLARARLNAAERRSVLFPATAAELWLAQLRAALDHARGNEITAVDVGNQAARRGVPEMDRQAEALRDRLARVRAQLIQDPAAAKVELDAILAAMQDLHTGVALATNLDTADRVWQQLYDSLSFMGEVRAAFGHHGNDLIEDRLHEALQFETEWQELLRLWRSGHRADARRQLEEKTAPGGDWSKWLSDVAGLIRDERSYDALMTFAAMIGVALISGGLGAYVEAAAGTAWGVGAGASAWTELGAAGLGTLTEATSFTALSYPMTTRDPSWGGFGEQLGVNLLLVGGGRGVGRAFEGVVGAEAATTALGRIGSALTVGGTMLGANLAIAEIQSGGHLTARQAAELSIENVAFLGAMTVAHTLLRTPLENLRLRGRLEERSARLDRSLGRVRATMEELPSSGPPDARLKARLTHEVGRALADEQALVDELATRVARADRLEGAARDRELARAGISAELAARLQSGEIQSRVLTSVHQMQGARVRAALEPVGNDYAVASDMYQEAQAWFGSLPDTTVTPEVGLPFELRAGSSAETASPRPATAADVESGTLSLAGAERAGIDGVRSFVVEQRGEPPFRVYERAGGASGELAPRVEIAPDVAAVASARAPEARPVTTSGGRAEPNTIEWGMPDAAIQGVRERLLDRHDVGAVVGSMRDGRFEANSRQILAVKKYLFDNPGIRFDRANYEAWQRLAARRPQVRDVAFIVHEIAEIHELEGIRRRTGFDYRGRRFDDLTETQQDRWRADFNRYYRQSHTRALEEEYRYVARAVAEETNGRTRIRPTIAAAVDPIRAEGREHMLVDGVPLEQHHDFETWQARGREPVEVGTNARARLRLGANPTLADLVARVKMSPAGPEAAANQLRARGAIGMFAPGTPRPDTGRGGAPSGSRAPSDQPQRLTLYHGSSEEGIASIRAGVRVDVNSPNPGRQQWGPGFYLGDEPAARRYARQTDSPAIATFHDVQLDNLGTVLDLTTGAGKDRWETFMNERLASKSRRELWRLNTEWRGRWFEEFLARERLDPDVVIAPHERTGPQVVIRSQRAADLLNAYLHTR